MGNNIFKYIFIIIVIALIGFGIYKMAKNNEEITNENLDQTSTVSNIQTDLRFAICGFDTINPILSNNRNVQEISKIIYEPLVTLNDAYKIEYCLAEEIAKTDELNYIVKTKKGILWQDGTEFTAHDVQFTIDCIKHAGEHGIKSAYESNLAAIAEVDAIDDYTVRITLFEPVDFFEYHLTFPVLPKNYYADQDFYDSEKSRKPIGTGMFQIENMDSNIINLKKNNLYWNTTKIPMANEININLYNTAGELYNAFKNGEVDIVDVKISNVEEYIGSIGYKKIEYKSRDYDFLALNTQSEVLSSHAVRKAISKVIDKNNVVASCLGPGYVASNFSLDMGNWLYTRDLSVPVNLDEANQILAEDGWEYKNNRWRKLVDRRMVDLTFSISVNGNDAKRVAVAENIKNQLANIGIHASVRQLGNEAYSAALANKNFDVILTGITCGYSPSVKTFLGENNLANYRNSQVSEIMNVISNTSDENQLYEKYNQLYDIYLEDVPYIGLYRNTHSVIYNQSLVGNIKANDFNLYNNIEKWYRQ